MRKKSTSIPVNNFGEEGGMGITIERMVVQVLPAAEMLGEAERHNWHSFHLLESGNLTIEIDFETYKMKGPAIIYMHPNQVHSISAAKNFTATSWAISNENLNAGYLKLMERIAPAKPLALNKKTFTTLCQAATLCIKLAEQKNNRLYKPLLKDSCNTLVALVISDYLARTKPVENLSRSDTITNAFNQLLERSYTTTKNPAGYAQKLHISAPYLNECVKAATGYPVSHHIQQRVVLEAKRLLYHSNKSVKEIAMELGYDDYPYFSRLFTKVAGVSALVFRHKNHE